MKILVLIPAFLLATTLTAAPPRFTFEDLGPATAFGAMNNRGNIAFSRKSTTDDRVHPHLLLDGAVIDIGLLPNAFQGFARGLNDANVVVGSMDEGNGRNRGFRFNPATREFVALPRLPVGDSSDASDISPGGVVAASSNRSPGTFVFRAIRIVNGLVTDLGVSPGYDRSAAIAVGTNGDIIGQDFVIQPAIRSAPFRSRLLPNGQSERTNLPGFPGVAITYVEDATAALDVFVGSASPGPNALFPYLHDATGYRALPVLGGFYSSVRAVSASRQMVGSCELSRSNAGVDARATFYDDGQVFDLNTLTTVPNGGKLTTAEDINDVGQIAGTYRTADNQTHLYRLSPPARITPTVRILGKKTTTTRSATLVVRGIAEDRDGELARVEVKVDKAKWKKARGLAKWRFAARGLELGRNAIRARALDATGLRSRPAKLAVLRQP